MKARGKVAILVPDGTQIEEYEKIIKKRLPAYFSNTSEQLKVDLKGTETKEFSFTLLGINDNSALYFILKLSSFSFNLIRVLFEPRGWFLFWTGLDFLISSIRSKQSEAQFYSRMEAVHVEFGSYK